ncbi:hypothetical protein [Rhizobium sp. HT1-10]|uniref:hypothetical protein n=1 Tax=Rhizobium sp. HT1-10 TaxID=3111638 RepID=UPI003C1AC9B1
MTLAIAWKVPRAWLWVALLATDFIATSLFWDYGNHEFHPIFTLAVDGLVCLAAHLWAQEKWELGFFLAFLSSVFISLLKLAGFVPSNLIYASFLELFNYCALLLISGIGILDVTARHERGFLSSLRRSLHSARSAV